MRPLHTDIVKRHHAGQQNIQIAEDLNITPQTVSNIVNGDKGKRLRALLAHYEYAIEGPNEAQRRNALWRIALDNEEDEPKTAISAIAELNRMTLADYTQKQTNAPQTTTIIINQNILPKGPLDQ